jgi:hypothetical protein
VFPSVEVLVVMEVVPVAAWLGVDGASSIATPDSPFTELWMPSA